MLKTIEYSALVQVKPQSLKLASRKQGTDN